MCRIENYIRKCYRKTVNLPGEHCSEKTRKRGTIRVEDISMEGLRYSSLSPHNLETGEAVEVKFRLDDRDKTEIKKKAVVLRVKGLGVAIKFTDKNEWDKQLGFYMMP